MSTWTETKSVPKSPVAEHIDRCVELYGNPIDSEFKRRVDLASYEQMRADLMILVGIVIGMNAKGIAP